MDAPASTAPGEPAGPAPRLGDYAITARLERRPAADVYAATHAPTGAPRLLYVLRPGAMQQAGFVHRLAHEVDAARWMSHPSVAKVDVCAETPNGRLYVAVERPAGRSLARTLAEGGRLSAGRVVRLGNRLVEALAEAHAIGLVHGRLTPAAVVLADGWDEGAPALVRLTGFGVATVAHDDAVVGVDAAYVSPEQRAGAEPDVRSDVFGLAALLHHALFGEAPPEHEGDGALRLDRADAVEHLPAAVVLAAARAADPACRPASVKAFWEDLLDALVTDAGAEPAPTAEARVAAAPPSEPAVAPSPVAGAAPPSLGGPPARARRRLMTHALWLAMPLGGAAAAGWPMTKHQAAPARPPVAAPAAVRVAAVLPAAAATAAAPTAPPTATPAPDSAARPVHLARAVPRADVHGTTRNAPPVPAPAAPAADTMKPAPGAGVAVPIILLVPSDAPRPARPVTRPDDFPDRYGREPGGH